MTKRKREYLAYMKSEHWYSLRRAVLARDGYKCVVCGADYNLQVHHKRYRKDFQDMPMECLITVCRNCHKTLHERKRAERRERRRLRKLKGQEAKQFCCKAAWLIANFSAEAPV